MDEEYLLKNLELYYPFIFDKMVEHRVYRDDQLEVKTSDGEAYIFDAMEKSFRQLPNDSKNMTKEQVTIEFHRRLVKIMRKKGVTQSDLVEMTDIPQPQINRYCYGDTIPNFYTLDKITKALDCSLDDLRYL